jgi:hypothetical protein
LASEEFEGNRLPKQNLRLAGIAGYNPTRTSRNQTGKSFLYPDFTNRPDQKSNGLNPGDSANPDTTIKSLLFLHRFNFKVTIAKDLGK